MADNPTPHQRIEELRVVLRKWLPKEFEVGRIVDQLKEFTLIEIL